MIVQKIILPIVYRLSCFQKVDEKLVVFADAHHHELPFSMRYLYAKVKEEGYKTKLVISDYQRDGSVTTFKQMCQFMKLYGRAKFVVICDNFLPAASCQKRKETTVIQLWHACGAFKKFGYDTTDDIPKMYKGNVLKNCDCVTVSGEFCVSHYASAMRLPESNIKPFGVSRTDFYYHDKFKGNMQKRFWEIFPEARGKKVILWAPTFRGNPSAPYLQGVQTIAELEEKLGSDWFVVAAVHPHLKGKISTSIRTCDMLTEEMLPVVDLLITDYSSIVFDFMIMEKPTVLFVPDVREYKKNRGFYIELEELSDQVVVKEEELLAAVKDEYTSCTIEKLRLGKDKYMEACDGRATERILAFMQSK